MVGVKIKVEVEVGAWIRIRDLLRVWGWGRFGLFFWWFGVGKGFWCLLRSCFALRPVLVLMVLVGDCLKRSLLVGRVVRK